MQRAQGRQQLFKNVACAIHAESVFRRAQEHLFKRLALQVFHYQIGCAIFLEQILAANGAGLTQLVEHTSLFEKTPAAAFHHPTPKRMNLNRAIGIALHTALGKKFFDRNSLIEQAVFCPVSNAKATFAQNTVETVFPTMQNSAFGQGVLKVTGNICLAVRAMTGNGFWPGCMADRATVLGHSRSSWDRFWSQAWKGDLSLF
jgi:hypothetical protein